MQRSISDRNVLGLLFHIIRSYEGTIDPVTGREKGLPLGNQKTQIMPISEGVDFLGFRFYLTDTGKVIRRLRTSNKRRWMRRLKKYKEEYRIRAKSYDEIRRSIVSYNGHLAHGHTWKLRKKVMGGYVLTHAPKNENEAADDTQN